MGDALFCPFISKLSGDLHIMLGLLESALKSDHINCVASPRVDTSKLMGISQRDSSHDIPWPCE